MSLRFRQAAALIVLGGFAWASLPSFAGDAGKVRAEAFQNLSQGVAAYKRGEFKIAVEKLQASAAVALNNFRANYYLGLALIGDRRYADALDALDVALDLDPGHLQSHVAVGNAYLKMGDLTEAEAGYFRALKVRPVYPPGLDGLARVYEARARDDKAIDHFRQAIASDRGYAPAYTHLGDLYLRQDRFEEAVLLLQEAVSIRPDYTPGLNRLALALGRLGFDNQAVATIKRAIELEPQNATHPATLGQLELFNGYLGAAEKSYLLSLELDPALPEARIGLAEVARRRGDYERSMEQVEVALGDPRTATLIRKRIEKYRELLVAERHEVERLETIVEMDLASPGELDALASIYAGRGLWGRAAELAGKAPESAPQQERLAFLLFQEGRFRDAHRIYAALAEESGRADLVFNDGVALARLGNDPLAIEAYRKALALQPDNLKLQLYLGNSLLRTGQEEQAIQAYRTYLEENSEGEAAERVRRILKQIAPEAIPNRPASPTAAGAPAPRGPSS